jgi:hypothetical protein
LFDSRINNCPFLSFPLSPHHSNISVSRYFCFHCISHTFHLPPHRPHFHSSFLTIVTSIFLYITPIITFQYYSIFLYITPIITFQYYSIFHLITPIITFQYYSIFHLITPIITFQYYSIFLYITPIITFQYYSIFHLITPIITLSGMTTSQ